MRANDFGVDPDGAPVIERIDPFEIYPDPASGKRNYEDGRRVFRVRKMPRDDAVALVGGVDDEHEVDAVWAAVDTGDDQRETLERSIDREVNPLRDGWPTWILIRKSPRLSTRGLLCFDLGGSRNGASARIRCGVQPASTFLPCRPLHAGDGVRSALENLRASLATHEATSAIPTSLTSAGRGHRYLNSIHEGQAHYSNVTATSQQRRAHCATRLS